MKNVTPSWFIVGLTGTGSFLVGVLLVIALGGPKPPPARTVTKIAHSITTGVDVYVRVRVPSLVGESLTDAQSDLKAIGFQSDVSGISVIDDLFGGGNGGYKVSSQEPKAGTFVRRGGTVKLHVE